MRDKGLSNIAALRVAGRHKALVAITLTADAMDLPASHRCRQLGCSAAPAGPRLASLILACLPKLRRVNAMQAQPNLTNLQRIAINRSRFALQ
jgi:hypothetical protein